MKKLNLKANTKKIIVLCSMVALLVVTGTLNFFLNKPATNDPGDAVVSAGYFASYRSQREALRAELIAELDLIIKNDYSTDAERAAANARKIEITNEQSVELTLEGLIKAQGYEDVLVTLSTKNMNIIVKAETFETVNANQILQIIVAETDYTARQVVLTPYLNKEAL